MFHSHHFPRGFYRKRKSLILKLKKKPHIYTNETHTHMSLYTDIYTYIHIYKYIRVHIYNIKHFLSPKAFFFF